MSAKAAIWSVVLITAAVAGPSASADEPGSLHATDRPDRLPATPPASRSDPASLVLQKNPDFALWDTDRKLAPPLAGLIYQVERADGARLLLSVPSEGLRGWSAARGVIPLSQGESYFSYVVRIKPGDPFPRLMRAIVRHANGDPERALADVDDALRRDPQSVAARIERARIWQAGHRPDRARADLDRAIALDPGNPSAFAERGVLAFAQQEFAKCRRDLDRAAELGSHAVILDVLRGRMDLDQRDPKQAYDRFVHALQIDPKRHDAYLGLASTYLMRGQPRSARAVLDQAVQIDPNNPEAYGNRAIFFLNREDYQQALFNLDEVIRLAPTSPRAFRERAWLLAACPVARLRNGRQAIASATRGCELTDWKEPPYLAALAAACSEAGDFEAAIRYQDRAIALAGPEDKDRSGSRAMLVRYQARKPAHSLGLLEDLGILGRRPTSE